MALSVEPSAIPLATLAGLILGIFVGTSSSPLDQTIFCCRPTLHVSYISTRAEIQVWLYIVPARRPPCTTFSSLPHPSCSSSVPGFAQKASAFYSTTHLPVLSVAMWLKQAMGRGVSRCREMCGISNVAIPR